jgi:PAS domain-containing protein
MVGIFSEETEAVMARESLESNRDRMRSVLELAECLDASPVTASGDRIASILCETLGARAVAVYFYDPYATTLLAGRHGGWTEGAPPDDFSELRLPAAVWTTMPGSLLKGHEMGALEGLFDNCFVLPLGSGSDSAGFIVSVDVPESQLTDIYTTGGIVSSLLQTGLLRHMERSEKEQLEFQRSGDRQFLEALLSSVDSPVAVFSEDWKVLHWNEAMEKVTGIGREAVTAHPDMAAERLFGPVGGTAGLRKLLRTGLTEPQGTWVLEGSDPPVTLRVRKAGNPGGGVHSAAYVLTGLDSSDRIGFERAQEALAGYEVLTRGSADLLSARGWQEIADITSRVCLAVSGAMRVDVKLRGRAESTAGAGPADDASAVGDSWSEAVGSPSRGIGECIFLGGRKSQAVTSFLAGVGRAVSEMENRAIGAGLMELSAGSRGRFIFSLPDGSVLFSTWPVSVLRRDSGTTIGSLFHGDSLEAAWRMIRKASATGRASGTLRDVEGADRSLQVVALSGEGMERLLLWWPVEPGGDAAPDPRSTADDLEREILRLMASSAGTGASVLRGVKKSLGGDTAMAAQLQAVIYEAMSAGRLLGYLELLETASRECSGTFHVDDLVRLTMVDLADGGYRPPDLEVADGLPDAAGSLYVAKELLARACRLSAGPAGNARLTVELESVARMEPGTAPELYPWTTDELVIIELQGTTSIPVPPEPGDLIAMIRDGLMGPAVEMGLIRHIMRLTGCDLLHGGGKGTLVFVLPVAGAPAGQ